MATREMFVIGVLFNLYWLLAVIGQNAYLWLLTGLLVTCWWLTQEVWKCALILALGGMAMDFALSQLGVFEFESPGIPAWLVLLWFGFGTFLSMMREVVTRYAMGWVVLLGGIGGPFSYFAGYRLDAVSLPFGVVPSIAILMICWLGYSILALKLLSYWRASKQEA